ncbi:2-acyl-glycerophospho-ethanolamine acyltransferase [Kingella kingae]|uniref:lysophospholipid acyltransferase family protein n=1 Tax=Kingella kingae TaxID=504 RepID=UPI00041ACA5D|nr:lysophospholipid acyltransferase family protein [Kingella kingae]MDK4578076.1 lysophospholipid acyltransferase family protein [Kingella kingae]MDK4608902.1 lysophospholipid acyltransferase family protein [Kingella kingae]MDK4626815.1 lysophospholipid acyltransferase family protein [Kingella kingae]MDK4674551.1 lysophospholipid acyltransferase family protein [Kingella kingae]QIP46924.1 1-acyl-sn-glycerol-3-phosphate acyltransferase [Kingella kingae]
MPIFLQRFFAWLIDQVLYFFVSFITGVRPKFEGDIAFSPEKKVYFANHASHGDFVMVWISLPKPWRKLARPVAGADYWLKGKIRRFVIQQVFNGLLIMRNGNDPKAITEQMTAALQEGSSLIIFPEGTRNTDDDVVLLPFKSGIYHLARENPDVQFVPIWIDNINRVLPKGKLIPVPIICSVNIGQEMQLFPGESKDEFLQRARDAMLALAPEGKRLPAPK